MSEETDDDALFEAAMAELAGEPAEKPKAESEPEPQAAAEPEAEPEPAPAPAADDPKAGLTDAQRAYFDRLEQSDRSQRGRVAALQKQIDAMRLTQAVATTKPAEPVEDDEAAWKEAEEIAPEVTRPLTRRLAAYDAEIKQLRAVAEEGAKRATRDAAAAGLSEIGAKHADFQEVIHSPEFLTWIEDPSLPRALRGAIEANRDTLQDAGDVIFLLDHFKSSLPKAVTGPTKATSRQHRMDGALALHGSPAKPDMGGGANVEDEVLFERELRRLAASRG